MNGGAEHIPGIALHATTFEVLLRVLAAMGAGAALGWEPDRSRRFAGIRTFVLIGVGSALASTATIAFSEGTLPPMDEHVTLDPFRILAGLLGAIGFLCAGTIIHSGGKVHGLMSAAGLFLTGVIGMVLGLGMYWMAAIGLVAGMVTFPLARSSTINRDTSDKEFDDESP